MSLRHEVLELSSEKPDAVAPEEEPAPPAPEPEPEPAEVVEPGPPQDERAWDEDYEEHIDGEEPPPPKPRKKRRYGGIIVLVIIILFMIVWTVLSPKMLPKVGDSYVSDPDYASLGDYTGYRDIWAGNMTWGVAMSGPDTATVGTPINISVLIVKIDERPGNWFIRGTAISLKNVSFFEEDGTCIGTMSNWSDVGFGLVATVPVVFDQPGLYSIYAYVRFLVFIDMRIGFLPLEAEEIPQAYLDMEILVT